MKGNKGLYIMLPTVAVIWMVIGYRIVTYIHGTGNTNPHKVKPELKLEMNNIPVDSFSISANYRDPFLGSIPAEKRIARTPVEKPKPALPVAPVTKTASPYPKIVFHGLVRNNKSNKIYGIISINGKIKTLSEKEEVDGLKIITITNDSVVTLYAKQLMVFKK